MSKRPRPPAAPERAPGPSRHMLALEEIRLRGPQRALVFGAALLFGLGALWATFARLPEVAAATGQVVTESPAATVQHLEGGIVAEIFVREGERVEASGAILRMDGAAAESEHRQHGARLADLRRREARLAAFVEQVETTRAGAAESWGDAVAGIAALSAREGAGAASLAARLAGLASRLAVVSGELAQSRAEAAALDSQIAATRVETELMRAERATREDLEVRGLATRVSLLEARRLELASEGEALRLVGARAVAAGAIAEREARLADIRAAAVEEAQREAAAVEAERAELEAAMSRLDDRLRRVVVRAPEAGVVRGLAALRPGAVIEPGALIAEIMPENGRLVVDVQVSPRDIGFVKAGQPADIKLEAFDHARYGVLPGVVERISAGAFRDEQGRLYHRVRVGFGPRPTEGRAATVAPAAGMAAQAAIITGHKTVLQYLLKPLFAYGGEALHER